MKAHLLWSGWVIAAVFVVSSCATFEPLKPTNNTAVIKAGQWGEVYRGGYVELVSVSGVEPSWRLRSDMQVGAGNHIGLFYVYLCNSGSTQCNNSVAEAQFDFRAEAGHTYRVRAREQVNGSNRFWVWLLDEATGDAVGGTPPSSGSS